ncbi:serine hydroxymethyltransferase [Candidatus Gracilibacteria bacterium]|nr:serine hydroxymethyltransferase [Candidatus Gracilibacteria bacterium]MCF7856663.1 serine hydroxymethyltransferase [Candidatus Gracilibacteria bacterium]MCF7896994.1 serine hydroxymethyltransferase [Candidatus Gracilibacteria bacterium]
MDYKFIPTADLEIFELIRAEEARQKNGLELIASENYTSAAVLETMASVLQNKYSEGYPGRRYYAGNEVVDSVESLAIERAKKLFGAEFVNVQALSGSSANLAVYFALVQPGDTILGLKLDHGGHLSHGHPINFTGKTYNFVHYGVEDDSGLVDMDKVEALAKEHKPKMIVAGFSAYSRDFDWVRFKKIADEVGAITFADIAHVAGLIAGKAIAGPIEAGFDVVTTTTHKTLRGPRGALIFSKTEEIAKKINRSVFPGIQGGPHEHIIAAIAVALGEALKPEFQTYAKQVILNAQKLAVELISRGFKIISDGTDNHLMVVDLQNKNVGGKEFTDALDRAGISASASTIPNDPNPPMKPSGIRFGTAAITTRGMGEAEMIQVAEWIARVADDSSEENLAAIKKEIAELAAKFLVPGA